VNHSQQVGVFLTELSEREGQVDDLFEWERVGQFQVPQDLSLRVSGQTTPFVRDFITGDPIEPQQIRSFYDVKLAPRDDERRSHHVVATLSRQSPRDVASDAGVVLSEQSLESQGVGMR
jgi:hypothetical protein